MISLSRVRTSKERSESYRVGSSIVSSDYIVFLWVGVLKGYSVLVLVGLRLFSGGQILLE